MGSPWHSHRLPSCSSPPGPSSPSCGPAGAGCLPVVPAVFYPFALFMLIYLFCPPGQSLCCPQGSWAPPAALVGAVFGGALGEYWAGGCIPAALSPSCTPAPLPHGSEDRPRLHRGPGGAGGHGMPTPGPLEPPRASSGSSWGAGPPRMDCE